MPKPGEKIIEKNDEIFKLEKAKGSGAGVFTKLYGEQLENIKEDLKMHNGYVDSKFSDSYKNKELGIEVGTYDKDWWAGNPHAEMLYLNGVFVIRDKEQTYSAGPEFKWKGGGGVKHENHISSIESVKIENNRILADIKFWDGSIRTEDIGAYELPPVYTVYRNNKTYDNANLLKIVKSLTGEHKIVTDIEKGIFNQGTSIEDNDYIKSIPENAIVITDTAALKSLPELEQKKVIKIEDFLEGNYGSLGYYANKIDSYPYQIIIYKPGCADHVIPEAREEGIENYDEDKYAEYLKKQLVAAYPGRVSLDIVVTRDPKDLKKSRFRVIDRHSLSAKPSEYLAGSDLILPPSENESKGNQSLDKKINNFLKNEITKIEKAKE
ncbi:MAG: hypothetical protein WCN88_02515 [Candidatus Falkowbacteria bacterium]